MKKYNNFSEKKNAPKGIITHKKKRKNGIIVISKENRYNKIKYHKSHIEFSKYDKKSHYIDEYLRRCIAVQSL